MTRLGVFEKNDNAGLSPAIWSQMPRDVFTNKMKAVCVGMGGMPLISATAELGQGEWRIFADTGGTGTSEDAIAHLGGAITIASDGDNEGCSLGSATQPFLLTKAGQPFAFEARIQTSTITVTKHGIFVGVMDNTPLTAIVPITATGTLADVNQCGFWRPEGNTAGLDWGYKANGVTAVELVGDIHDLVAATYVKLGITAIGGILTAYIDGVPHATTYSLPDATGSDFPADILMGTVCGVLNGTGTTPGSSTVSWMRAAQLLAP